MIDEPITDAQKRKIAWEFSRCHVLGGEKPWGNIDKWIAHGVIDKLVKGMPLAAMSELEMHKFTFSEEDKLNAREAYE